MILCFDIGGTTIKTAEAFSLSDIQSGPRVPTPTKNYADFIAALRGAVARASTPPRSLAFSIAGITDPVTGFARVANIPCLSGRPLIASLEADLSLPIVLANDADCFVLAEAQLGRGKGHEVVFGVILGTGVGGGIVIRNQLINLRGGFAGEWGHGPTVQRLIGGQTLPHLPCGCGQSGCLETLTSARGIETLHQHLHDLRQDSRQIIAEWQAGQTKARQTIEIWLELLSAPLSVIVNLLGPGIIPVGGGLSGSGELIAALDMATRAKTLSRQAHPLVVPASGFIEPGLIGAAVLGFGQTSHPHA